MNAKERRALRRLEIRNEKQAARLDYVQGVANQLLRENVEKDIALRSVEELLTEAMAILGTVWRKPR